MMKSQKNSHDNIPKKENPMINIMVSSFIKKSKKDANYGIIKTFKKIFQSI